MASEKSNSVFVKPTKSKDSLSDKEVVGLVVDEGRREYLEVIYDRYADKVFYKCLGLTKDPNLAKDLAHDILVKVFLKLKSYKRVSAFSMWIYAVTYNHCMDFLKKKKKERTEEFSTERYDQISPHDDELNEKVLLEAKYDKLESAIEKLKPDQRALLMMRYMDGLSIKAIAEILEASDSAIKMRLKRSREQLAKIINN